MQIIIHGSTGRMGQNMIACARAAGYGIAAEISPEVVENPAENRFLTLPQYTGAADCVVDFSHHSATPDLLAYCVERKLPVVIATTGQTAEEMDMIRKAAESIPVFYSGNMSVGIAVLASLAKTAAAAFPNADIEIVEKHHNQKLDVPSGTALLLANRIREARTEATLLVGRHENGKRTAAEIGIHSLRYGNEVGTHEIIISTGRETLTLKHEAENRALFADGALSAATFLCGKAPGMYNMQDIVG